MLPVWVTACVQLLKKGYFDINANNRHDKQPHEYFKNHVFSLIIIIALHY